MPVSPAFGVLDVSRVAIAGNFTRLSKSWSGAQIRSVTDAKLGQAVVNRAGLVAVGVAVDPGLDRIAVLQAGTTHSDEG